MARLRVDFVASTPKDPQHPELNEDAWQLDDAWQRWALADGASESYDSRAWAHLLVSRYVESPAVGPLWVAEGVREYVSTVDASKLSWSQQGAFERGSFSTLLGIEMAQNGADVEVLAIGDSVALHVRAGRVVNGYPFHTIVDFPDRPKLLSTLTSLNEFISEPGFMTNNSSRTWAVEPGDVLLLMTDAVAYWALREAGESPSSIEMLLGIVSEAEFEEAVLRLRHERHMKLDDSTLVRLVVEAR